VRCSRARLALVLGAAALGGCSTPDALGPDGSAPERDGARDTAPDTAPATAAPRPPDGAPAARLALSLAELDLGTVNIGNQATNVVVVTNTGDRASAPLAASVAAAADFQASNNCAGRRLGIGETCAVTVQFVPTSVGAKTTMGQVAQTEGDTAALTFRARGTGRLAPDAGAPEAGRDAGPDVPPEVRPADAGVPEARRMADSGVDRGSQ
jgi:hypothetical protein